MIFDQKKKEVRDALHTLRNAPSFAVLVAQLELHINTAVKAGAYVKDGTAPWSNGRLSALLELYDDFTIQRGENGG
jgi:hypothetical protein